MVVPVLTPEPDMAENYQVGSSENNHGMSLSAIGSGSGSTSSSGLPADTRGDPGDNNSGRNAGIIGNILHSLGIGHTGTGSGVGLGLGSSGNMGDSNTDIGSIQVGSVDSDGGLRVTDSGMIGGCGNGGGDSGGDGLRGGLSSSRGTSGTKGGKSDGADSDSGVGTKPGIRGGEPGIRVHLGNVRVTSDIADGSGDDEEELRGGIPGGREGLSIFRGGSTDISKFGSSITSADSSNARGGSDSLGEMSISSFGGSFGIAVSVTVSVG